jgi:hypothetical protein
MLWTAPRRVESLSLIWCLLARRVGRHRLSSVMRHLASRLSKVDREQLERLVALRPGNDGKVVNMRAESPGVIRIMTGVRSGPRSGTGKVLRATKSRDGWQLEVVGGWRS